jgi:hypothetical protein
MAIPERERETGAFVAALQPRTASNASDESPLEDKPVMNPATPSIPGI